MVFEMDLARLPFCPKEIVHVRLKQRKPDCDEDVTHNGSRIASLKRTIGVIGYYLSLPVCKDRLFISLKLNRKAGRAEVVCANA